MDREGRYGDFRSSFASFMCIHCQTFTRSRLLIQDRTVHKRTGTVATSSNPTVLGEGKNCAGRHSWTCLKCVIALGAWDASFFSALALFLQFAILFCSCPNTWSSVKSGSLCSALVLEYEQSLVSRTPPMRSQSPEVGSGSGSEIDRTPNHARDGSKRDWPLALQHPSTFCMVRNPW